MRCVYANDVWPISECCDSGSAVKFYKQQEISKYVPTFAAVIALLIKISVFWDKEILSNSPFHSSL